MSTHTLAPTGPTFIDIVHGTAPSRDHSGHSKPKFKVNDDIKPSDSPLTKSQQISDKRVEIMDSMFPNEGALETEPCCCDCFGNSPLQRAAPDNHPAGLRSVTARDIRSGARHAPSMGVSTPRRGAAGNMVATERVGCDSGSRRTGSGRRVPIPCASCRPLARRAGRSDLSCR